jgi:hypothetical protein
VADCVPIDLTAERIISIGFDVRRTGLAHYVVMADQPERHRRFAGTILRTGNGAVADEVFVTADGAQWRVRVEEVRRG